MTVTLRWGAASHEGEVRDQNEDAFVAEDRLFIVADGMGGHQAGEVASAMAIAELRSNLDTISDIDDVVALVRAANRGIIQESEFDHDRQGMGTTLTGLVLLGQDPADDDSGASMAVVNVGDSRTYRLRNGDLRRLTVDHSYVQELVNDGMLTDEEARTHPRRNIVTRALGIDDPLDVDGWTVPVAQGDRFLVCSDGLSDEVAEDDIRDVLAAMGDPQEAADLLVQMARDHGGRDNVTVIVVEVVEAATPAAGAGTIIAGGGTPADDPGDTVATAGTNGEVALAAAPLIELPADDIAATEAEPEPLRRRRTILLVAFWLLVASVFVGSFAVVAAYARTGYFLTFSEDDEVVIYKGREGGLLWFDPTVADRRALFRDQLDTASVERVESSRSHGSFDQAVAFAETLSTTTTTTTTIPPTTVPPDTVAPATTPGAPPSATPAPDTTGG